MMHVYIERGSRVEFFDATAPDCFSHICSTPAVFCSWHHFCVVPKAQVAVDLLISSHAASYYGLRCSQAEGAHKQAKTRFSG